MLHPLDNVDFWYKIKLIVYQIVNDGTWGGYLIIYYR